MDLNDFKALLNDIYGINDSNLPSGLTLDNLINYATKKLSLYYPEIEQTTLTTTAGQTRYTVSHDNLIRLKLALYQKDVEITNIFNINEEAPYNIGNFSLSRKLTQIYEKQFYDVLNPKGIDIINHNTFDVIPTPDTEITIYYEYERYRTLEEIPDIFEEDMVELVMYYIAERNYQKSRAINEGNTYTFDRRGNITTNDADDMKTKYEMRKETLKDVINNIKNKVMKLKG